MNSDFLEFFAENSQKSAIPEKFEVEVGSRTEIQGARLKPACLMLF